MKCYKCGKTYGVFRGIEFQTVDGVVKEHRDYCLTCFNKMYSSSIHKVIKLLEDEDREM